ncbi:MAG: alpha amylase [Acholeplasmataceae bacterium]|nr:alpha amylase [Acholeplasmataceae bacterium]
MKKLWLLLIMISLIPLSSCKGKKEYVLNGPESNIIDDNYRTYYEIFVGGFSDSNGDGIGDIRGMINRLDYLNDGNPDSGKSLGITGIWLMPIMPSNSYHKYDVRNYKDIDRNYGTLEDFTEFLKKTEERGIKVIIDLVINHTSNLHPWFKEFKKAVEENDTTNKYYSYYSLYTKEEVEAITNKKFYKITNNYYYEGNFDSSMPELNFDNEDVKNEFIDIMEFWINLGVDGFRIDAAKYVYLHEEDKNVEFFNWLAKEAKKLKEDIYLVGEIWDRNSVILPYYEAISAFDFQMSESGGRVASTARGVDSVNSYVKYLNNYKNSVKEIRSDAILQPFISNHDQNRAAGYLNVDSGLMHIAANLYILTYGTPFIYYGEEIGMKGVRGNENTDANRRLAMLWGDKDKVLDPIGSTFDKKLQTNGTVKSQIGDKNSLYNHYKKLIMIRNAYPQIARGEYTPLEFDGYYNFGGFLTTYNGKTLAVFHNTMDVAVEVNLNKFADVTFKRILSYVGIGSAILDGQVLTLDGYTSVIIEL